MPSPVEIIFAVDMLKDILNKSANRKSDNLQRQLASIDEKQSGAATKLKHVIRETRSMVQSDPNLFKYSKQLDDLSHKAEGYTQDAKNLSGDESIGSYETSEKRALKNTFGGLGGVVGDIPIIGEVARGLTELTGGADKARSNILDERRNALKAKATKAYNGVQKVTATRFDEPVRKDVYDGVQ